MKLDGGRFIVNPGSVGLQTYEDDRPLPHRMEMRSPHARYAFVGSNWAVNFAPSNMTGMLRRQSRRRTDGTTGPSLFAAVLLSKAFKPEYLSA